MRWRQWRAPRKPSIARPPLPGLRKLRNGKRAKYLCVGGPLHGATVVLSDGNSAVFAMSHAPGPVRGRYECAIVATERWHGETHWRPR